MSKRVLITGGSGLIGRPLASGLAADGWEVLVLTRSPDSVTGLPDGVRAVGWDARSADGWGHLAEGADAIVNLAGATISKPWTAAQRDRIRESRLNATGAVVEAVRSAKRAPRVLVQGSAIGYYGPRHDEPVSADAPAGEGFLADVCAEWEAASAPVEELGVRRAVARTSLVFAEDGGALPLMLLPFKLFVGGPVGSGRQPVAWIHLDDEVAAIRHLMENDDARGPFNLSAPDVVTNAEFGRVAGEVLGRPSWLPTPAIALRLGLGEMSSLILGGQRAEPTGLRNLGFEFQYPDLRSALRDIVK